MCQNPSAIQNTISLEMNQITASYFSDLKDSRLHRVKKPNTLRQITPGDSPESLPEPEVQAPAGAYAKTT